MMEGMRGGMLVLGVVLLLLAFPDIAAADDAVLGRIGEAVQPIHSAQVRMVEEDVSIKLYPTRCEVTATFRFRNDGPDTSILVGFPEGSLGDDESRVDTTLHEFSATVDGQPVQVMREVGLQPDQNPRAYDYPSWLTWEMELSPGQTREVFPGDFRFDGDRLVWEWQDIEPTADLRLVFNPEVYN